MPFVSDKKPPILNAFSLVMLTLVSVDSMRNLAVMATFGRSFLFFVAIALLLFLLPSILVSIELVATWPEHGGVYVWVKHAFGRKIGLLTIWFQWIQNIVWYPTILSFVAASIGYLIAPELIQNKLFMGGTILLAFWGMTLINIFGLRSSIWFSNFCAIFGLLLPMAVIIVLGIVWVKSGYPVQQTTSFSSSFSEFRSASAWVALTAIIMSFCGIEVATFHVRDVYNPRRSFPQALIIAGFILVVTFVLGSITLTLVLPRDKINLLSGIMQILDLFLKTYNLSWLMPLMGASVLLGSMGGISNWILAPTKSTAAAVYDGYLPKHFAQENKRGAPSKLLIYQALTVTLLVVILLLLPSVSGFYWLLTVLAVQLYMCMYILMFLSGIILRFKYPNQDRPFRIFGSNWGILLMSGIGIIGAAITILVGFIPPENIVMGNNWSYEIMLCVGLVIMLSPPFILFFWNRLKPVKALG